MAGIDPIANPRYTYLQAADTLAARIQAGTYTTRLPAERDLAEEYGVAYQTIRHAIAVLRERGLVITRHGRGTYIKDQQ